MNNRVTLPLYAIDFALQVKHLCVLNQKQMKPKFFFIALLLVSIGTTAFAQDKKGTEPLTAVYFPEAITSLSINDNLTVILTEGASPNISVEGDAKAVIAKFEDGHLLLSAGNQYQTAKPVVYVPAALLKKVFLNDAATLRSATALKQGKLKIFMSGEGKVDVRTLGAITIETIDDVEFIKAR